MRDRTQGPGRMVQTCYPADITQEVVSRGAKSSSRIQDGEPGSTALSVEHLALRYCGRG